MDLLKKHIYKFAINAVDKDFSYGCQTLVFSFDDIKIKANLSYLSPEPLNSLVEGAATLMVDDVVSNKYFIKWELEPGYFHFHMTKEGELLHIHTFFNDDEYDERKDDRDSREFYINFENYKEAVKIEIIRMIKKYGILGYNRNWCDGISSVNITALLILMGAEQSFDENLDQYSSVLKEELKLLASIISSKQT